MEPAESLIKEAIENEGWEPHHQKEAMALLKSLNRHTIASFKALLRLIQITESDFLKDVLISGVHLNHGISGTFTLMEMTLLNLMGPQEAPAEPFIGDSRIMPPVSVNIEMPSGAAVPPKKI
jgi:hypothetical protein